MVQNYTFLLCIILLIGCSSLSASPSYYCYKTGNSINVDGNMRENAWKNVPPVELRNIATASDSKHPADAKMIWDQKQLYVSFETDRTSSRQRVLLNPLADAKNYVAFDFDTHNQSCKVTVGNISDHSTRCIEHLAGLKYSVRNAESRSYLEISIPWSLFEKINAGIHSPVSGDVWKAYLSSESDCSWPVMKHTSQYDLSRLGYLIFSEHPAEYNDTKNINSLEWKMVWLWTMNDKSDEEVVSAAKNLGFNAISARSKQMVEECHKQNMQAFAAIWFGNAPEEYAQVIKPEEKEPRKWGDGPVKDLYQYGGEPVLGGDIFREGNCWCLDRPESLEYGKSAIDAYIADGYDGIAFDAIGYTNLYACFCPVTLAKLQDYKKAHPEMSAQQAVYKYSEQSLLSFYTNLVDYARKQKPGIKLTTHIYPVFAPDPVYGSILPVDYCGQTTAWFFKPHWNMEKVERYSREIVYGDASSNSKGAPFVAIYTLPPYDMHAKSAERVRQELRLLKKSGAHALQMAELGNILNDPELARVVKEELSGGK